MSDCILLSVSGQTPQIITETLCSLRMAERTVRDIYVVTTRPGKENIERMLLGINRKTGERGNDIFIEMSREYGWPDLTLKEENILVFRDSQNHELEDIRTDQDEGIAADFLFKTLRDLIEKFPETPVVASIAGGRKTMSYLMGSVMSILGRRDDELTHVLVDPRYEAIDAVKSGGQFFYRCKNSRKFYTRSGEELDGATAEVELSSIPFIRMGHFLKDSKQWGKLMASGNRDNIYSEAINYINSEMTVSPEDVYVTLDWQDAALDIEVRKDIRPARYRAELTPIQFAFYALILCYRKKLAEVFGDNGRLLAESGNLPTPPNKQMLLLDIGKELKTLFQNWLYLFSLLPADPFTDTGKYCRSKMQLDVDKVINGVNRNFASGKKEQDAYTLEEPIDTIACDEPLWGAFEGSYDAVYYAWEHYKNEAALNHRMRKGIGQVLGDRKSEQFDHTMDSFFVAQYNLWRKMVTGINAAVQNSGCPEAVSALVSVSEKASCYVIGRFEKTKFSFESGLRDDQFNMGEINPVQFIKFEA
ncbi:CRISPR-associated ring nuclease Csm6 [Succinimonas sp.]|uniref:CRISPR-associated ring nuclease Csm6 n=1 Tax=Succinimonas sp. TaxID=1936151 RepID=UPI00386CBC9B